MLDDIKVSHALAGPHIDHLNSLDLIHFGPCPEPPFQTVPSVWCGMESCGNRIKAAAYRARRWQAGTASGGDAP